MSNRPATVTQADVRRVIRACQREGLAVARVVVRPDGVSIETDDGAQHPVERPNNRLEDRPPVVL